MLTLAHPELKPGDDVSRQPAVGSGAALQALPHIRVGRISLDERVDTSAADVATIRRLYTDACQSPARSGTWRRREGMPDPGGARELVDDLAQAVAQNRTALVALTALKDYDNYTFTHMVNVSILTMAQARGLGIEGTLLREFGLAALMHDIGKVRTPIEILNKPDKLTDDEFAIMRMHVVDGAEILRRTPDMPALAPVVAFEHHLRLDGTGYPLGVKRPVAQPRHDAVQHRRRLRRHAIAARLSGVVPDRSHPRRAEAQRRHAVRPAPGAPLLAADGHLSAGQPGAARHRRDCAWSCASTRPIRIGRRSASSSAPTARSSRDRATSISGKRPKTAARPQAI